MVIYCILQYEEFQQRIRSVVDWVQRKLDDHRAAFDPDKIEDFIDAYLGAAQHLQQNEAKETSLTGECIAPIACFHSVGMMLILRTMMMNINNEDDDYDDDDNDGDDNHGVDSYEDHKDDGDDDN